MAQQSTIASASTSEKCTSSPISRLALAASSFDVTSALAKIAAASLVTASAGFGAYYAWTTGSEHGAVLGVLFVLFAVGLEIAKPLSVVAAFKALGAWQVVRGAALAVLAVVAISYSLSAELTLMAGTRGDVVAERQAALNATTDTAADARRARERYDAAKHELGSMAPSRPAAEVQAEIDGLLLTPGANGCKVVDGRVTREVCPKVSALRIEKARADRRSELEAVLTTPLTVAATTNPRNGKNVRDADPGSSALATYLAALGFTLPANVISDWLALVPVVALELASAMAGILIQAVSASGRNTLRQELGRGVLSSIGTDVSALPTPMAQPVFLPPLGSVPACPKKADRDDDRDGPTNGSRLGTALLGHLRENGGTVRGGQRGLAKLLGTSTTEFHRTLRKLADAGLVLVTPDRLAGTTIELAAG